MNSLKSLAMNCGPLSEMIRGFASGYFSRARCKMTSISAYLPSTTSIPESSNSSFGGESFPARSVKRSLSTVMI